MTKWLLIIFLMLWPNVATAQGTVSYGPEVGKTGRLLVAPPPDTEDKAAEARTAREKMYRRLDQSSKRAVNSICDECRGPRYNRPRPVTPLFSSDGSASASTVPSWAPQPLVEGAEPSNDEAFSN
jgi:hypothetical protein